MRALVAVLQALPDATERAEYITTRHCRYLRQHAIAHPEDQLIQADINWYRWIQEHAAWVNDLAERFDPTQWALEFPFLEQFPATAVFMRYFLPWTQQQQCKQDSTPIRCDGLLPCSPSTHAHLYDESGAPSEMISLEDFAWADSVFHAPEEEPEMRRLDGLATPVPATLSPIAEDLSSSLGAQVTRVCELVRQRDPLYQFRF